MKPNFLKTLFAAMIALLSFSLTASAATITSKHFEGGKNLTAGSKQGSGGHLAELVMSLQDSDSTLGAAVIKKDGSVAFTAAQSMGTFKLTNLATPTASADAATKAYVDGKILPFTCSAGAGGAATEVLTCTGVLATDTVLAVTQQTKGGNNLPLLGWSTLANNAITGIWSANPGSGSVVLIAVKR